MAEALAACEDAVFFFGGGAEVSPEVFLFSLLTTAAEPEVMMSETFTTAQKISIIIYTNRSEKKTKKGNLQGF